jgi:hypothetical protein
MAKNKNFTGYQSTPDPPLYFEVGWREGGLYFVGGYLNVLEGDRQRGVYTLWGRGRKEWRV